MSRAFALLSVVVLAACGQEAKPDGNVADANFVAEKVADHCAAPTLAFLDGSQPLLSRITMDETKSNFVAAFKSACAKGVLKAGPLIDPKAADQKQLFLVNAPEANAASIYLSEIDGNRMVLEYPFLTTDGKSQAPSADELEEAIYCSVHGATPEEQEESGRCLVD